MDKNPVIHQVEVVGAGGSNSTPDMDINISRNPLSAAFPGLSSASLHAFAKAAASTDLDIRNSVSLLSYRPWNSL